METLPPQYYYLETYRDEISEIRKKHVQNIQGHQRYIDHIEGLTFITIRHQSQLPWYVSDWQRDAPVTNIFSSTLVRPNAEFVERES